MAQTGDDQEDFLVLAGEALAIVEGEEHPLRRWDFVHCSPGTSHVIVAPEKGRAWYSPSAPATAPGAPTGAPTPLMKPRKPRRRCRAGDDRL